MTPELETSILSSDTIKNHASDHAYAHELYSVITLYKLAKRSFVPLGKKDVSDYSRRLAASIVSTLRGTEDYAYWYSREPIATISKRVQQDLKQAGWIIVTVNQSVSHNRVEEQSGDPIKKKPWWKF